MPRCVAIVAPGGPRRPFLTAAAAAAHIDLHIVPWPDVATARGDLTALSPHRDAFAHADVLKVESPGACPRTRAALLLASDPPPEARRTPQPHELHEPGRVATGLHHILCGIEDSLPQFPHLAVANEMEAIRTANDKAATAARLTEEGVPRPEGFRATNARTLAEQLERERWPEVFIKLRCGACGAGIFHLTTFPRPAGRATVRRGPDSRVYGVFGMPLVPQREWRDTLRWLLSEGAWVERGLATARLGLARLDLRIVVIDGQPCHTVGRASRLPVTNLSQGGRRVPAEEARAVLGPRAWTDAHEIAVQAAAAIGLRIAGVDVVVDVEGHAHVIDVNPWGDFFPRAEKTGRPSLFAQGLTRPWTPAGHHVQGRVGANTCG